MPDDPTTVFKNGHFKLGDANSVAYHKLRYTVDDIKQMGRATSATVNDVLLAALAAALRKWGTVDKGSTKDLDLTSVIWVSKSPMSDQYKSLEERPLEWGNGNLGAVYMR